MNKQRTLPSNINKVVLVFKDEYLNDLTYSNIELN